MCPRSLLTSSRAVLGRCSNCTRHRLLNVSIQQAMLQLVLKRYAIQSINQCKHKTIVSLSHCKKHVLVHLYCCKYKFSYSFLNPHRTKANCSWIWSMKQLKQNDNYSWMSYKLEVFIPAMDQIPVSRSKYQCVHNLKEPRDLCQTNCMQFLEKLVDVQGGN